VGAHSDMTMAIDFSWIDGTGVEGPDHRAWADVSVRFGGRALEAVDFRARTVRRQFFTTLLPFTEWLVNAWPCLIEQRAKASPRMPHLWLSAHSLRSGRGGGPMPDVRIARRDDNTCDVTAHEDVVRPPGISLSFLGAEPLRVALVDICRELSSIVEAVRERMRGADDWSFNHLTESWSRVQSPAVLAGGRLGLCLDDFDALTDSELLVLDAIRSDIRFLAVAEASAREPLSEKLEDARRLLAEIPTVEQPPENNVWIAARVEARGNAPWTVGWGVAELVRQRASLDANEPLGTQLRPWLEGFFGWPRDRQIVESSSRIDGIDMITVRQRGKMPISLVPHMNETGIRFRVAKSLYYALSSDDTFVVDSARLPRSSEANAFAAELLAPRAFIESRIPAGGWWSTEDVDNVARECAVLPRVIEHQIENRNLGVYER
jgi:hypothetical protein